jgi:tetratricopeptide (TPR) repeat protein
MNTFRIALAALLATLVTGWAAAPAAEQPLEFLHGLQEKDYGDVAIDYLNMLKAGGNMPEAVREVWDLEMSKSLRASASRAFDAKDFERLMGEAQTYLNKFLKEKPDHPAAVSAMVSWGNFTMDRALNYLRAGKTAKDKAQRAAQLQQARDALTDARPKFEKSIPKFQQQLAALPPLPAQLKTREDRAALAARDAIEKSWLEARFQLGLCDYYMAQAYDVDEKAMQAALKPKPAPVAPKPDPKAKPDAKPAAPPKPPAPTPADIAVQLLKRAAEVFDKIYQTNRVDRFNRVSVIGLYAHMWHGRVVDEMGDDQLARDIYDEVLANIGQEGMEDLFAQVELFRMQIVAKQSSAQAFVEEGVEWLKTNERTSKGTDGYAGIAVEVAKKCIQISEKVEKAADKQRYLSIARTILADAVKNRGSHQAEAIMLRRRLTGSETDVSSVKTFDEALAIADTALQAEQWKDAVAAYARAFELSGNVRDQERLKQAKDRYGLARLKFSLVQFGEGKVAEAYQEAGKMVQEYDGTAIAPAAAAVAVQAALRLFATANAQDRAAALERVEKVAKFTEEKWPEKPEADDARIALGQAAIVRGNVEDAIAIFEKVNPKSERYPVGLHWAGVTYWRRSLTERQKPENARNKEQMEGDRVKASERFAKSLELQQKALEAGKTMPQQMVDTQLALGEIRLEEGKAEEAVKLFSPLVELKKEAKGGEGGGVDNTTLRIFVGAVQSYTAVNDFDKAAGVGELLLEMGPDLPPINRVLVEFAKLVYVEYQKADAAVTEAKDDKAREAAKKKRTDVAKMLGNLLKQLAARKENSLAGMVYVADRCVDVGMDAEAKDQYQRIVKRTEEDPAFAAQAGRAMTRIRAQLIGLLRKEGNNEEAFTQVEQLVKDNPRALEPRMERGRILVNWADKEREGGKGEDALKHYEEGAKHWGALRNLLQGMRKKPPEVYECTFGAAYCLYQVAVAKKSSDETVATQKASDAEKLLKSTMIVSPSLSGPDMVAKYNELLEKVTKFLGR